MSSVKAYYDRAFGTAAARAYSPESEGTFQARMEAALGWLPAGRLRLLDYGCERGAATAVFAEAGHEVVGVDISEEALAIAQRRAPGASFQVVESEREIPLPDQSFDVCYCAEVVEHLFVIEGFLAEVHRLLADDGLFLLTTPYHGWLKNLLVITFFFDRHFDIYGGHIRFFSRQSLTAALVKAGFVVEHFEGIGRFWPVWKTMFVVGRKG